jgi:hypothetical protein
MLEIRNFLVPTAMGGLGVVAVLTMFGMNDITDRLSIAHCRSPASVVIDIESDDEETKKVADSRRSPCWAEKFAVCLTVLTSILSVVLVEVGSAENLRFQLLQCVTSVCTSRTFA